MQYRDNYMVDVSFSSFIVPMCFLPDAYLWCTCALPCWWCWADFHLVPDRLRAPDSRLGWYTSWTGNMPAAPGLTPRNAHNWNLWIRPWIKRKLIRKEVKWVTMNKTPGVGRSVCILVNNVEKTAKCHWKIRTRFRIILCFYFICLIW